MILWKLRTLANTFSVKLLFLSSFLSLISTNKLFCWQSNMQIREKFYCSTFRLHIFFLSYSIVIFILFVFSLSKNLIKYPRYDWSFSSFFDSQMMRFSNISSYYSSIVSPNYWIFFAFLFPPFFMKWVPNLMRLIFF